MTLKVRVDVDRNFAIKTGSTRFGRLDVDLTDADLATLTPEEREEITLLEIATDTLIAYHAVTREPSGGVSYSSSHSWTVLTPDVAGVRAALALHRQHRAMIAEEVAQRERERAAKRIEEIASALAAPVEDLIAEHWGKYQRTSAWNRVSDAPELAAKCLEVEAEIDRRNAEHEEYEAKQKAKKASEAKAKEAVQTAANEDFVAFALAGHAGAAVARAAAEEYDVERDVIDAVQSQFPQPDEISDPDDEWCWEERSSPSEDAFRLRDTLTGAVQAVRHKPESVRLHVSRIMRITEPDGDDGEEGAKRTGVVVTISSPLTVDRHLLYFVEP